MKTCLERLTYPFVITTHRPTSSRVIWLLTKHYKDVIMGTIASQITSLASVYSAVSLGADQKKHQSSASLAFVRGVHRRPVNSPHKGPVRGKCFHLMTSSCTKRQAMASRRTSDVYVRRRRGSQLVQIMACRHHVNQCWFIINLLFVGSFTMTFVATDICILVYRYLKISSEKCRLFWLSLDTLQYPLHLDKRFHKQMPLQWRHCERDGTSNHRRLDCLLNRLFWHRSWKASKFHITGLCDGNPLETGGFPSQRASKREMFSFDDVILVEWLE